MTPAMTRPPLEKQMYFALKQLYQLERLREMKGPKELEDNIIRQLKESHASLGDRLWEQVHKLYPSFRDDQRQQEAQNDLWEEKCLKCQHWDGSFNNDGTGRYCGMYNVADITKPKPCPSFKLKVLN